MEVQRRGTRQHQHQSCPPSLETKSTQPSPKLGLTQVVWVSKKQQQGSQVGFSLCLARRRGSTFSFFNCGALLGYYFLMMSHDDNVVDDEIAFSRALSEMNSSQGQLWFMEENTDLIFTFPAKLYSTAQRNEEEEGEERFSRLRRHHHHPLHNAIWAIY